MDRAFFDIAADLRARSKTEKAPVRAGASQINKARAVARRGYGYDATQYDADGF